MAEVAQHCTEGDGWVVISGEVYDLSRFFSIHPGGAHVLRAELGKDATDVFQLYHNDSVLARYGPKLRIDRVVGCVKGGAAEPEKNDGSKEFGEMVALLCSFFHIVFRFPVKFGFAGIKPQCRPFM